MSAMIDMTGQRIGRLTVIENTGRAKRGGGIIWRCACDCGKIVLRSRASLVKKTKKGFNPGVKSCGCWTTENLLKHHGSYRKMDLAGKRYNKIEILRDVGKRNKSGSILWECRCDCGTVFLTPVTIVVRGLVKSCGCMRKVVPQGMTIGQYNAKYLRDRYVRGTLYGMGIPHGAITQPMIDLKRHQLKLYRKVKLAKREAKNGLNSIKC